MIDMARRRDFLYGLRAEERFRASEKEAWFIAL